MEWQPIETVPKDTMKSVLIFGDEGVELVWWSEKWSNWLDHGGTIAFNENPTHWMPIPADPN
jgi:hypothetical protein